MTARPFIFRRIRRQLLARLVFAWAAAGLAPQAARAADEPPHELEEKTSAELEKIRPLLEAKNWDAALRIVHAARANVAAESYDMAELTNIEARLYLQIGDYPKVIEPWEITLRLNDKHHYFDEKTTQEIIYYLAQIYYQEAAKPKVPLDEQRKGFARATELLERWLANTKKTPSDSALQDAVSFYSLILYGQATIVPDHIDQTLLRRSQDEVEKGLEMVSRPKEQLYQLLLAILQQKNDYSRLADTLELLVKTHPQKKDYWSELANIYVNLAGEADKDKHADRAREYNIRAILTIERAQALGFMRSPKDNYTLVGIYYNVGQFSRATELLHAGLRDGSIESQEGYWALLGSSYQQADQPYAAIDALKEATAHFPHSGQLEYQIAQIYYALNKPQDCFKALNAATTKDHLDKPGGVYGFLAYVAWELGKLEEAKAAVDKALDYPDGQKDKQLPILKKALIEALRERENAKQGSKSA